MVFEKFLGKDTQRLIAVIALALLGLNAIPVTAGMVAGIVGYNVFNMFPLAAALGVIAIITAYLLWNKEL